MAEVLSVDRVAAYRRHELHGACPPGYFAGRLSGCGRCGQPNDPPEYCPKRQPSTSVLGILAASHEALRAERDAALADVARLRARTHEFQQTYSQTLVPLQKRLAWFEGLWGRSLGWIETHQPDSEREEIEAWIARAPADVKDRIIRYPCSAAERARIGALLLMLAQVEIERDDRDAQIKKLADWILQNVPGEPSQSQGAVDTAIRLLGDLQEQATVSFTAYMDAELAAYCGPCFEGICEICIEERRQGGDGESCRCQHTGYYAYGLKRTREVVTELLGALDQAIKISDGTAPGLFPPGMPPDWKWALQEISKRGAEWRKLRDASARFGKEGS